MLSVSVLNTAVYQESMISAVTSWDGWREETAVKTQAAICHTADSIQHVCMCVCVYGLRSTQHINRLQRQKWTLCLQSPADRHRCSSVSLIGWVTVCCQQSNGGCVCVHLCVSLCVEICERKARSLYLVCSSACHAKVKFFFLHHMLLMIVVCVSKLCPCDSKTANTLRWRCYKYFSQCIIYTCSFYSHDQKNNENSKVFNWFKGTMCMCSVKS